MSETPTALSIYGCIQIRTANGMGVHRRHTRSWEDKAEVIQEGELLEVLEPGYLSVETGWYYVRVVESGRRGYVPSELTIPVDLARCELPVVWTDAGLISETEYESPQWGYTVEWDAPYVLDTEADDEPVETQPDSTDDGTAFDRVWLYSDDPQCFVAVYGYSFEEYGYADEEEAISDWVEYWTSDEYLENDDLFGANVAVILEDKGRNTGGVVIYDTDDDGVPYIRYKGVLLSADGESVIALDFSGYLKDLEDSLGDLQSEIEIDGETIFSTFDFDDISDAIDSM